MDFKKIVALATLLLAPLSAHADCIYPETESGTESETESPKKITTVIYDLNGVVFDTARFEMARLEIGIWLCAAYLFQFCNPGNIKARMFAFLDTISGPQVVKTGEELAYADGLPMPELMRQWKTGEKTGLEVIALVEKALGSREYTSFFYNSTEKALIRNIIRATFNPTILASHTYPIPAGVKILEDCAAKNHELFILSNAAPDMLAAFMAKPESDQIFKHFKPENIVISGNIHKLKPSAGTFEYLKSRFDLDPETCVFIDDHQNNTDAAKAAGFNAICIQRGNFARVREELVKMGVLDK